MAVCVRLLIEGRVQGVGFRYATRAEANRRNVTGWVRNLPDGQVEVEIEGEEDAVDAMVAWCQHGPRYARVHKTTVVSRGAAQHGYTSFSICG